MPATDGMLVGREHELKAVEEFVLRAASDEDALVLYGEAGVGKTVLLDAAEEAAAASGVPVIRTVGVEVETDLAYAALYRLLTPFLSQLDELSGQQRRTLATALGLDEGPPPDRLAVSNAALSLLGLARGDGPLLVIVDDLPWLDRMSAAVLAFVARRLAGARIGFLGAFRTGESSFFDGGGLAAVEVMPLGQTAAASLIDRRYPALAPRVRQQVLAEAAGNPLALLELPARVADRSHERQTAPALPLSQRLEHLFAARVDPLPTPTRRALLLAALDATGDMLTCTCTSNMYAVQSRPSHLPVGRHPPLQWLASRHVADPVDRLSRPRERRRPPPPGGPSPRPGDQLAPGSEASPLRQHSKTTQMSSSSSTAKTRTRKKNRASGAFSRKTPGGGTRGAGYGNQTSQMPSSPASLRSTSNADSKRSSSA
ncbi:ATP-binding protein [Streptomyces sp. NBC_00271]|uniref:ATP-binding protein n=1 Tax=Streptomyces sp. NBC_00271 TaxID=2975697 RepID=UPI002E2E4C8C|nr:ATP-binding protein [Streptomyces sp. NBC_00271]